MLEYPTRSFEFNNEMWWTARDVCNKFSLGSVHNAVTRLEEDCKRKERVKSVDSGPQETWLINQKGVLTLIVRCKKHSIWPVQDHIIDLFLQHHKIIPESRA